MDGAGKFKAKGALKWRSGWWKKGNRVQWEARDANDMTIRTIDKDGDREEASENFQDVKKLDVTNTLPPKVVNQFSSTFESIDSGELNVSYDDDRVATNKFKNRANVQKHSTPQFSQLDSKMISPILKFKDNQRLKKDEKSFLSPDFASMLKKKLTHNINDIQVSFILYFSDFTFISLNCFI